MTLNLICDVYSLVCGCFQDFQCPLHIASMKGTLPIAVSLMDDGADVTVQDRVNTH